MGKAVAICLAIGVATVAVAATPRLGRRIPPLVRPRQRIEPFAGPAAPVAVPQARAQDLADAIVETQNAEIDSTKATVADMEKAGVEKGDLGMEMDHMGMSGDTANLEKANPFDREFIDMMIPHHQVAIRMARVQLDEGKDPDVRKLAQAIIDAQAKEIDEMNTWRVDWYGGLSPAGGVPAEAHEEAEHH